MEVLEEVRPSQVRQTCRSLGITGATVWRRGVQHVPDLGVPEGQGAIVALARIGTGKRRTVAWIGRPVTAGT